MAAAGLLLSATATSAMAAGNDRIIISGASGQLGGEAVKDLLAKGVPAKSLILVSRTPDVLLEYAKRSARPRVLATLASPNPWPRPLPAARACC